MNIKIYQAFYKPEHVAGLQAAFIPYNNIKNEQPMLREYPFLLDLYEKHRHFDGHWGLVSWLFLHKTNLTSAAAISLITDNPGYDVYHFNPYTDIATHFANPFAHGEYAGYHRGMVPFMNKLLDKIGYPDVDLGHVRFKSHQFIWCSYYIGNENFWDRWIPFLSTCIQVAESDPELNEYLHGYTSVHNGKNDVSNFSFVAERLAGLFAYMYEDSLKVKMFDCRSNDHHFVKKILS
jgi:hypothetical protein